VAKGHEAAEGGFRLLRPFFLGFDHVFYYLRDKYQTVVRWILGGGKIPSLAAFVLIVVAMGYLFQRMPTAYLPDEDQGMLMSMVQLPPGSTKEQTDEVMEKVARHFLEDQKDAVESCMYISGFSFAGRGQNQGMAFVKLRDWDLRNRPDLRVTAVTGKANRAFAGLRNAVAYAFSPPAITELGTSVGFDFMLQDRGGLGHEALMQARGQLLAMAAKDPRLARVRPNGLEDVPEYRSDVDWEKAGTWGVPLANIHQTISAAFGSAYVNDFIQGGRVKRVYVQADAPYRMSGTTMAEWCHSAPWHRAGGSTPHPVLRGTTASRR
jgi:HAE1 family hydrophobic/amphiphilic exporter-1